MYARRDSLAQKPRSVALHKRLILLCGIEQVRLPTIRCFGAAILPVRSATCSVESKSPVLSRVSHPLIVRLHAVLRRAFSPPFSQRTSG